MRVVTASLCGGLIAAVAALSLGAERQHQIAAADPELTPRPIVEEARVAGSRIIRYGYPLPRVDPKTATNWPVHSLNSANRRFSPSRQINPANVRSLAPRWLFQTGVIQGFSFENTPVVVDGVMYVTSSQGSVYAIDAATGDRIWTFLIGGKSFDQANRGVAYGDSYVYVAAGTSLYALDPRTGEPRETFGTKGKADVVAEALKSRFPDLADASLLGYVFSMAPQYYDGKVFVGASVSDRNIPSGMLIAVDARTGRIVWKFNTVPQGPEDEGWEIAGPTWAGGARNGGGLWGTPAIDPELGTVFAAVANPSPERDGSARKGINLFTNSVVALDVRTGKYKWHFQQVHHDLWNRDSASQPILVDVQLGGKTVKVVAEASKNGYLYLLDRETGRPVHGVQEMPVPTGTDVPGEQPWPTQPIPLKADGKPMEPFVPTTATDLPVEVAGQDVPYMSPPLLNRVTVWAPGNRGGANYGPCSFSPRTGLIYVSGLDDPAAGKVNPVGASLPAGAPSTASASYPIRRPPRGTFTAYDVASGEMAWQQHLPGWVQAGSVVTAGDLVFVGDSRGFFHAFEARSGKELWRFNAGSGIHGSPIVYELGGEQFVTVASGGRPMSGTPGGDLIITFALPRP
jgi:alcohol dehydrogenase (cytochrome c)